MMTNKRKKPLGPSKNKKQKSGMWTAHVVGDGADTNTINTLSELWITMIDVGQGESTLIRYREQTAGSPWLDMHVVLVDGGRSHYASDTIVPTLNALGVRGIHSIVCSHYDADHLEGLTALSELPAPNAFVAATEVYERATLTRGEDDKVAKFRDAYPARRRAMRVGDIIDLGPQCHIRCVHVGTGSVWAEENDYSIGLQVSFGRFSFYLGGDLTSAKEDSLHLGHVCAFKCGHHGSKHSTSTAFLGGMTSSAAFISAATHSYCHPDDETIGRLCTSASVRGVYLTNCAYNRAGVNENFAASEDALITSVWTKITEWRVTHNGLLANTPPQFNTITGLVDRDAFNALLGQAKLDIKDSVTRGHLPGAGNADARRAWNELASLYFSAFDMHTNRAARAARVRKGVVAGDAGNLGNVHIVVPGAAAKVFGCSFTVYFYSNGAMQEVHHQCGQDVVAPQVSTRPDVVTVVRAAGATWTAPFSVITGPSGVDKQNITPDDVATLAEDIDDLITQIQEMTTEERDEVREFFANETVPDDPSEAFDAFLASYIAVQEVQERVANDYGNDYELKDPKTEVETQLAQEDQEDSGSEVESDESSGDESGDFD